MGLSKSLPLGVAIGIFAVLMAGCFDVVLPVTLEPQFDTNAANVTVKEGEVAVLPCIISFLGDHQVLWTDKDHSVLTHQDRRVIDDNRISTERPTIKAWNLHIREVTHADEGTYKCQVNTNPVKLKEVTLKVRVPAKILNNGSTESVTVREGATVTLECRTAGIPEPTVSWRRLTLNDDGDPEPSESCPGSNIVGKQGEVLIIHNISRDCADLYQCVASNAIDTPVSRSIPVRVNFPPEVTVPTQRLGQDLGKETILECVIKANPQVRGIWMKNGKEIKNLSGRYRIVPYTEDRYSLILSLRIMMIHKEDYGVFTCEGSNDLGTHRDNMTLYYYSKHRKSQLATTTSTTTTTTHRPRRPPYVYPPRKQQQYHNRGYSNGGSSSSNSNTYTEPQQKQHVVQDGRLRYKAQGAKYEHGVAADTRRSRDRELSADRDSASFHSATVYSALQLAVVWLGLLTLMKTRCLEL